MADSIQSLQPRVLHISPLHDDVSHAMADAIGRVGLETADCEDVYRGLARLAFWGADLVVGIVVHVNPLSAFEFEFFELAVARWPDVPVFVYGDANSRTRVETALRLGANREVNEATIGAALTPLVRAPLQTSVERVSAAAGQRAGVRTGFSAGAESGRATLKSPGRRAVSQPRGRKGEEPPSDADSKPQRLRLVMPPKVDKKRGKAIESEPVASSPKSEAARFDDGFEDEVDAVEDDSPTSLTDQPGAVVDDDVSEEGVVETDKLEGPARVPWRRYGDRPKRIPPGKKSSTGKQADRDALPHDELLDDAAPDDDAFDDESPDGGAVVDEADVDEPLLGPEEIALLFGEDEKGIDEQDDED